MGAPASGLCGCALFSVNNQNLNLRHLRCYEMISRFVHDAFVLWFVVFLVPLAGTVRSTAYTRPLCEIFASFNHTHNGIMNLGTPRYLLDAGNSFTLRTSGNANSCAMMCSRSLKSAPDTHKEARHNTRFRQVTMRKIGRLSVKYSQAQSSTSPIANSSGTHHVIETRSRHVHRDL